jgi:hypothetical protein
VASPSSAAAEAGSTLICRELNRPTRRAVHLAPPFAFSSSDPNHPDPPMRTCHDPDQPIPIDNPDEQSR